MGDRNKLVYSQLSLLGLYLFKSHFKIDIKVSRHAELSSWSSVFSSRCASDKSKVTQTPGCPHRAQPNEDAGLAGARCPSPGLHSNGTGLCLPEGGRASLGAQCKDTMAGAQQRCSERNLAEPARPGQGSQGPGTPLGPQFHLSETAPLEALRNSYINISGGNTGTGLNMLAEIGPILTWSGAWTHPAQREKARHFSVEGHAQLRASVLKQPWSVKYAIHILY